MKKVMLFLSVTICLVCAIICCSKEKNSFAKNVPECIKERIKDNYCWRIKEYCTTDGTKRTYNFLSNPSQSISATWYDDNCNFSLVNSEEDPVHVLEPDDPIWNWGYLLPDGTIEYREDIYHFKRTVYLNKN